MQPFIKQLFADLLTLLPAVPARHVKLVLGVVCKFVNMDLVKYTIEGLAPCELRTIVIDYIKKKKNQRDCHLA